LVNGRKRNASMESAKAEWKKVMPCTFRHEVHKLPHSTLGKGCHRADTHTQGGAQERVCDGHELGDTEANCGGERSDFVATIHVRSSNACEHMPSASVGESPKTFTVGGSTGTGGGPTEAARSQPCGKAGVETVTTCDSVKSKLKE
jgi:hypothetical protein